MKIVILFVNVKLLMINWLNGSCEKIVVKLLRVGCCGSRVGGYDVIFVVGLNVVNIIMSIGSMIVVVMRRMIVKKIYWSGLWCW